MQFLCKNKSASKSVKVTGMVHELQKEKEPREDNSTLLQWEEAMIQSLLIISVL